MTALTTRCVQFSALEEGIIPGGGTVLYKMTYDWDNDSASDAEKIMRDALRAPFRQILVNAGTDPDSVSGQLTDFFSQGLNAKTGEVGDLYKMGIIDPAKVTKNALKNALSVATTILSTNAIVTMARTYETNQ